MRKEDFNFDLPEELIAQDPLEDRSSSRLLVLDKETGKTENHVFREIIDYLEAGDCLVINDTKVIPARLIGSKIGTDAKIEVLLLKKIEEKGVQIARVTLHVGLGTFRPVKVDLSLIHI